MKNYQIIDVSQWMHDFCFEGDQEFVVKGPFNRVPGKNPEFVYDFELCSQSGGGKRTGCLPYKNWDCGRGDPLLIQSDNFYF